MIKASQIFGWEHEPKHERGNGEMPSRLSGYSEYSNLNAIGAEAWAKLLPARRSPLMEPEAKRAPPSNAETTLSRLVPPWLQSLPPEANPVFLCLNFPRIANRLALCWSDPALAVQLIDEFFQDRRGTRRGFPVEATNELSALRKVAAERSKRR